MARFVLLEDVRRTPRQVYLDAADVADALCARKTDAIGADAPADVRERQLAFLEDCLQALTPEQRELIIEYYGDGRGQRIERRRELARRLGISTNALAIRAWRIRAALMASFAALGAGW